MFSRKDYKDIFIESLKFCNEKKGLILHAYCIMTNQIHLIVSSNGEQKLEDIIRDLKKFTSGEIIKAIENNEFESRRNWMLWIFKKAGERNSNNKKYQFWIQDNHPIELYDEKITHQKLNYIHNNPVEAAVVESAEEYLYNSAKNYAGL